MSAEPRSTRAFVSDKQVLQREAVGSSALQLPAYLILVAIAAAWLGTIAWGLARLAAGGGGTEASAERPSRVRSGGPRLRQPRPPAPAP